MKLRLRFHPHTFWLGVALIAGIGLVTLVRQIDDLSKNKSTTQSNLNPFNLNREQIVKSGPPSVRVFLAAVENTKENSSLTAHELINIAKQETGFHGSPFDKRYNPYQTSTAQAEGPFQVRVCAARAVLGATIKNMTNTEIRHKLKYDIEWNAMISSKYAELLCKRYKNNKLMAMSAYNKGYGHVKTTQDINSYARHVVNN